MRTLRGAAFVLVLQTVGAALALAQQPAPPSLSRQQRAALQAVVRAVEANTAIADISEADWPVHVLRASDGSHYVAFSAPAESALKETVVLYVRLATRPTGTASVAERSAVAEWLAGRTPSPLPNRRGIAIGEMPTYGAGAIATRGPGPQSLQLLEMERERARERREAEARQRKEALEGTATTRGPRPLLPFEDFDVGAAAVPASPHRFVMRRSLTSGPGDYDLVVAWVDPEARDPGTSVRGVRRRLTLPPASTTELALSSVIVADNVSMRDAPLSSSEQSSHPYTLGALEITPAPDHLLTNDERLAVVVQVINPRGSPTGKPDVAVGFRIFRRIGSNEELFGTLAPQTYTEATLPSDFDTAKRHPLFAAVAVPMRSFRRGDYRLEITASDRVAGVAVSTNAEFRVVATRAALLREAPPFVRPFRRDDLLRRPLLESILRSLTPRQPSLALGEALQAARDGRFADLVRQDDASIDEAGVRQVLRLIGLYALGDNVQSLVGSVQQPAVRAAALAASQTILGALRATEGNDREAVAAWEAAIAAGADARTLAPLIAEAWVRQGNLSRAREAAEQAADPSDTELMRQLALVRLAAGQFTEALRVLEALAARQPDDLETQWLIIHALFAGFVQGTGPGADAVDRARLIDLTERYIAAKGLHASLASDWLAAVKAP
jgi:tetratricopeptide (TPR) repeat protein